MQRMKMALVASASIIGIAAIVARSSYRKAVVTTFTTTQPGSTTGTGCNFDEEGSV